MIFNHSKHVQNLLRLCGTKRKSEKRFQYLLDKPQTVTLESLLHLLRSLQHVPWSQPVSITQTWELHHRTPVAALVYWTERLKLA